MNSSTRTFVAILVCCLTASAVPQDLRLPALGGSSTRAKLGTMLRVAPDNVTNRPLNLFLKPLVDARNRKDSTSVAGSAAGSSVASLVSLKPELNISTRKIPILPPLNVSSVLRGVNTTWMAGEALGALDAVGKVMVNEILALVKQRLADFEAVITSKTLAFDALVARLGDILELLERTQVTLASIGLRLEGASLGDLTSHLGDLTRLMRQNGSPQFCNVSVDATAMAEALPAALVGGPLGTALQTTAEAIDAALGATVTSFRESGAALAASVAGAFNESATALRRVPQDIANTTIAALRQERRDIEIQVTKLIDAAVARLNGSAMYLLQERRDIGTHFTELIDETVARINASVLDLQQERRDIGIHMAELVDAAVARLNASAMDLQQERRDIGTHVTKLIDAAVAQINESVASARRDPNQASESGVPPNHVKLETLLDAAMLRMETLLTNALDAKLQSRIDAAVASGLAKAFAAERLVSEKNPRCCCPTLPAESVSPAHQLEPTDDEDVYLQIVTTKAPQRIVSTPRLAIIRAPDDMFGESAAQRLEPLTASRLALQVRAMLDDLYGTGTLMVCHSYEPEVFVAANPRLVIPSDKSAEQQIFNSSMDARYTQKPNDASAVSLVRSDYLNVLLAELQSYRDTRRQVALCAQTTSEASGDSRRSVECLDIVADAP